MGRRQPCEDVGKSAPGRRDSECKSPEAEIQLLYSGDTKEATVWERWGEGHCEQGDLRGSGDTGRD